MLGYNGKILRVDLSTGDMKSEEYGESFYRTYFGGRGFNAYIQMKEVPAKVDPLSPENKLTISLGPLTGIPASGSGRSSVGAKNPQTGGYGEGDVGGFMGAELKHAGFDAIIVEGRADKPTYLWIHDGQYELRDASALWGQNTLETQEMIRAELGDAKIRAAMIGPGGENMVRYACVINDLKHAAGRSGMGAVMGSKNLKAIAVRGKSSPKYADLKAIGEQARWFGKNFMELSGGMYDLGTSGGVPNLSATGGLPTRNFQTGVFEHFANISGEGMKNTILIDRENCYACVIRCKRVVKVDEPYTVNPLYGGPEYETVGSLGSCVGVGDVKAVAKGNELCNAYSLDTIATGTVIAFAMECYENGLLTKADTDGIDLRFGNGDAMIAMIEKITRREGIGALLAEGSARAAKQIGRGAEDFAMHVKGQELPMHEPRIKQALGVGYSLSPTGADHVHNMHDTTMRPGPGMNEALSYGMQIDPLKFNDIGPEKMTLFTHHVNWSSLQNCLGMCIFVPWGQDRIVELMKATTGWNTNMFELMKVGERMNTLCRAINVRDGFTASDDTLPNRFFKEIGDPKSTTDPLDVKEWNDAKQFYYAAMGWTPEGVPTRYKLQELGLGWVADEIGV
jgi:aldehyde:ferredoxin oxidoreductase